MFLNKRGSILPDPSSTESNPTISRRQFNLAGTAGIATFCSQFPAPQQPAENLRVIAYNVFGGKGWPANRRLSKAAVAGGQMARRLAFELALHRPDIISFSEAPNEKVVRQIAEILKMNFVQFPGGGEWPGTLLSRFEITKPQNVPGIGDRPRQLFTRHWGRASVKLPNGESLIIHSAHLYPTANVTIRIKEIQTMLATMKNDLKSRRSMILMGDFNHGPNSQEYKLWTNAGWVDTFAKVGKGKGLTIKSDIPKWRVDYVMAAGPIADRVVESRPLFEGAFRLHIADKQSFALSDHLPQLAVFRLTKPLK